VPPTFKPAYLIHGDDHGRIAERRARLRGLAEAQSGTAGVEVFEDETSTPEAVALALNAMTFALGRRFVVVDGVEKWKEKELPPVLDALAGLQDDTTVAFFAREEGRTRVPEALHEAVRNAGGTVDTEDSVKPRELPRWVIGEAKKLGLTLEPDAARALIGHVGDRQQRLLRELEKLALGAGEEGTTLDVEEVEELTASSAERKAWSLADALLAGDPAAATRLFLALREQGERVPGLLYWMGQRIRQAHDIAAALEAGEPPGQIRRGLRMPSFAADRLIADAQRVGADRLRAAVQEIADLELASRGGAAGQRTEDTAMLLALQRIMG
jgi:DNA polymerase-3 subunit delta